MATPRSFYRPMNKPVLTCTTDSNVLLVPVDAATRPALENLFQLYVHDFSTFVPLDVDDNGRFEAPLADEWTTRDDHHAYLVREDETLRGFALVRRGSRVTDNPEPMDVAELFVVRSARGRGLGAKVVQTLFDSFPGRWEVRVRNGNAPALAFWSSVVTDEAAGEVEQAPHASDGASWTVFRFETE